jgi:hypothetical protein
VSKDVLHRLALVQNIYLLWMGKPQIIAGHLGWTCSQATKAFISSDNQNPDLQDIRENIRQKRHLWGSMTKGSSTRNSPVDEEIGKFTTIDPGEEYSMPALYFGPTRRLALGSRPLPVANGYGQSGPDLLVEGLC